MNKIWNWVKETNSTTFPLFFFIFVLFFTPSLAVFGLDFLFHNIDSRRENQIKENWELHLKNQRGEQISAEEYLKLERIGLIRRSKCPCGRK